MQNRIQGTKTHEKRGTLTVEVCTDEVSWSEVVTRLRGCCCGGCSINICAAVWCSNSCFWKSLLSSFGSVFTASSVAVDVLSPAYWVSSVYWTLVGLLPYWIAAICCSCFWSCSCSSWCCSSWWCKRCWWGICGCSSSCAGVPLSSPWFWCWLATWWAIRQSLTTFTLPAVH